METKESFKSTGLVYGNLWDGTEGAYPAKELKGESEEEILRQANKGIDDGNLDDGMGFESLTGALLLITKTITTDIKGKTFTNDEITEKFVGNLTEKEQNYLTETSSYMLC